MQKQFFLPLLFVCCFASANRAWSDGIGSDGGGNVGPGPTPLLIWRNLHFSSVANTGVSADSSDPDGDGLPNLAEYALGGAPNVPDAPTIAPKLGTSGSLLQLSFNCDISKTDVSYIVQASSDLVSWTDIAKSLGGATTQPISSLSTVTDAGAGARTVTVTDSTAISGKRFLRLKIVNPAPAPTPTPPPPTPPPPM